MVQIWGYRNWLPRFSLNVFSILLSYFTVNTLYHLFLSYRALFLSVHKMTNKCIQFSYLFDFFAPTCFGTCMPSSGSLCVPSKLFAHLLLSWVKSARWMEVDYSFLFGPKGTYFTWRQQQYVLKPTGYGMHKQVEYFNNCTLCPHCICVFCICLRTNSDLCHLQHKLIGFYNQNKVFTARYGLTI
jgi:hypothetical protein